MIIVGIEDVNYVSKKTGRAVSGVKLHLTYPLDEDKGEGQGVVSEFCSSNIPVVGTLAVGDEVEILYNRYGGIVDIRVL